MSDSNITRKKSRGARLDVMIPEDVAALLEAIVKVSGETSATEVRLALNFGLRKRAKDLGVEIKDGR